MKTATALLLTFFFAVLHSAFADDSSYTPPKLKWKKHKTGKVVVKQGQWDDSTLYKVEEDPEKERALASDEDDNEPSFVERNPSSKEWPTGSGPHKANPGE